jgi:hypothetical protein
MLSLGLLVYGDGPAAANRNDLLKSVGFFVVWPVHLKRKVLLEVSDCELRPVYSLWSARAAFYHESLFTK